MSTVSNKNPGTRFTVSQDILSYHINMSLSNMYIMAILVVEIGGGDEENRTPDPLLARQVLSQLSYAPILSCWWA